ncbi:MAG: hypothetical protein L6Q59_02845 [Ignavibacteriaceae bacterium]|nr:hypothetical protein [Ignavibacteriaceae bacterium]
MKILVFLFVFSVTASSQILFLSGGADYRFSSASGLDKFAERYNTTRANILTKKMEAPGTFNGWFLNLSGGISKLSFDIGYSQHSGKMKSETDPLLTTGGGTGRNIDLTMNNFWFGTGFNIAVTERFILIFPNFEADILSMSFKTTTNTDSKEGDFGTIANAGISMKIIIGIIPGLAISVQPSYNFSLLDSEFKPIYERTNTPYDPDTFDTKGSFSGFHLRIGAALYFMD